MENSGSYQPINCETHDGYELACMRQAIHKVSWLDENESFSETLRFLDLECNEGKEFLIAENESGTKFRIRLDTITTQLPY